MLNLVFNLAQVYFILKSVTKYIIVNIGCIYHYGMFKLIHLLSN